jgi:methylenetetrahydrofolate dehydrogenase (NADP+)/methenyltetrahydrofolate cyclohydrolase
MHRNHQCERRLEMTATLIKGTEIREQILEEITAEVAKIKASHGVVPGLVTILVGENPASISYVTLKIKTAHRVGFTEVQDSQPEDISEADLLALIDKYNNDDSINGILVQLPLPKHIDERKCSTPSIRTRMWTVSIRSMSAV